MSRTCSRAMIGVMNEDDMDHDSFEAKLRLIAQEVKQSVERMGRIDIDEIAEAIGVDPARARELADTAARWLNGHTDGLGDAAPFWGAFSGRVASDDSARKPGPHPLDVPTGEQGLALSALDSGRWTVEPGSSVLVTQGEGPGPTDPVGLVGELRARDWIAANGDVTQVGRNALSRWLDSANAH
jgi:hypothetical protein